MNLRQFTPEGTLRAFEAHLPRLADLGVGILWFMPIHPIGRVRRKGTLGSYYAVRDYGAVNPEHGTHRDFARVVRKCHALDLRVILDWVPNHTAWDHPWIRRYPEWYARGADGAIRPPVPGWTDVAQLDYGPDMGIRESYPEAKGRRIEERAHLTPARRALWSAMQTEMESWVLRHGVDGFRCDVAAALPLEFWQETRARLRRHGEIFLLAEADGARVHDRAFDATYGWTLQRGLEEVRASWQRRTGGNRRTDEHRRRADTVAPVPRAARTARTLQARLAADLRAYPPEALRMQMTSNHDANSWHGSVLHRLGAEGAELGAVLTFVFPGIPLIYNGQEAGSRRRLAFFEKDGIPWRPHRFFALYRKLATLKRDCPLLRSGREGAPLRFLRARADRDATSGRADDPDVLAFVREDERGSLLAVFCLGRSRNGRAGAGPIRLSLRLRHPVRLVLPSPASRVLPDTIPDGRVHLDLSVHGWDYGVWVSGRVPASG